MSTDGVECPLCGVCYPVGVIEQHAATCTGEPQASAPAPAGAGAPTGGKSKAEEEDEDFKLALKLQAELDAEDARERSQAFMCGLCKATVPVTDLYILDVSITASHCCSSLLRCKDPD